MKNWYYRPEVIFSDDIELWTESFGSEKDPAILLIMGSGGQGLLWPQSFCEQLADHGFFIIRYDHRDTGLSSSFNYAEKPYDLLDMGKDAILILNHYQLETAHILGASMGGVIATLMAAHFKERIDSLSLLMTTSDLRAAFDAFQGLPARSRLSPPSNAILEAAKSMTALPSTLAEKVQFFIDTAQLNSPQVKIDRALISQLSLQSLVRMRNELGAMNHFQASIASYDLHAEALSNIEAPTLILHGDCDPVFPIDHAYALKAAIQHSKLSIIPKLGHGLAHPNFYSPIIEKVNNHINAQL